MSSYLKYLDAPSTVQLAEKLVSEINTSEESCKLLCDLVSYLDEETKQSITKTIVEYCQKDETNYQLSLNLLSNLGQNMNEVFYEPKVKLLQSFLHSKKINFLPEFKEQIKDQPTEQVNDEVIDIMSILDFLEFMFIQKENSDTNTDPSVFLAVLLLLGYNEELIASKASGILRWQVSNIIHHYESSELWEKFIFPLEKSSLKFHRIHAYTLWLRILTKKNASTRINQTLLSSSYYWKCIQNGLNSPSHEHRKISLSILQVSLQQIDFSFANEYMSWDSAKSASYLKEWSRYVTLFEILAIDTSLHQSQAGANDIIRFISPDSLIDSSWGFCLIATGFSASMDSVRKFTLGLLLSIPAENLYLIKNGISFLEKVFLPNAMLASHFHTRKVGLSNVNSCVYGERLRQFVYEIVHCNGKIEEEKFIQIFNAIINVVCTVESFDPAKIYVLLGLLEGLQKENFTLLRFNENDQGLIQLFEYRTEGDLFAKTLQSICLRILFHFKRLSANEFLNVLDKFVQFNGCALVKENLSTIVEYFGGFPPNFVPESTSARALAYAFGSKNGKTFSLENHEDVLLVSKLLEQGLLTAEIPVDLNQYLEKLLSNNLISFENQVEEFSFYESVSSIEWKQTLDSSVLAAFWNSLDAEVQSDDQYTLIVAAKKLKLFAALNANTKITLTCSALLEFNSILFKNSRAISKQSTSFYKIREEALAQLYKIFVQYLPSTSDEDLYVEILDILNCNSLSHELNNSVADLLTVLLKLTTSSSTVVLIATKLYELWSTLNSARLFLNQKDLHCLIIRTLYDSKIISESKTQSEVGDVLLAFGREVIENASGRRCLLPVMTKLISDYQLSSDLEGAAWLPEILVRCYIVQQLNSNSFKLENVVGKLFDEHLAVDKTSSRLYFETYGAQEISARVNLMAILGSFTSELISHAVVEFIVDHQEEFNLFEVVKKTDGFEEWRRIQLMSMILIASNNIPISKFADTFYATFVGLLETDPSPLVRNYIEWIICKCLLGDVESQNVTNTFDGLKKLVGMNGGKPTLLTSYERILCMMIQQLPQQQEKELMTKFLTIVIPAATSNKAMTRHFSLSLICSVYPDIVAKKLDLDENLLFVMENMYTTALSSEQVGQHRSGDAILWNVVEDLNLVNISGGILLRVSDRDIDFITKESYEEYLSPQQLAALRVPVGHNFEDLWLTDRKLQGDKKAIDAGNKTAQSLAASTPLQTKSGALNSIVDVDASETISVTRSDLIVCASLVDKPPNLGGICRLSDVLGAGLLTLHDLKVKEHSQFKTVAVTADRWMPMVEVKPEGIIEYLMEKKKEGYTLIGLEQTDKSVQLSSELEFPKKSLILLGREKEGIPGNLLAELDFCVEIKQVGVIRSMNIQTATAIIVHAYSSQHC